MNLALGRGMWPCAHSRMCMCVCCVRIYECVCLCMCAPVGESVYIGLCVCLCVTARVNSRQQPLLGPLGNAESPPPVPGFRLTCAWQDGAEQPRGGSSRSRGSGCWEVEGLPGRLPPALCPQWQGPLKGRFRVPFSVPGPAPERPVGVTTRSGCCSPCVAVGKAVPFSGPQCPHLRNSLKRNRSDYPKLLPSAKGGRSGGTCVVPASSFYNMQPTQMYPGPLPWAREHVRVMFGSEHDQLGSLPSDADLLGNRTRQSWMQWMVFKGPPGSEPPELAANGPGWEWVPHCESEGPQTEKRRCGQQNNAPQHVSTLTLRTWEYVTFRGKRDFADGIK